MFGLGFVIGPAILVGVVAAIAYFVMLIRDGLTFPRSVAYFAALGLSIPLLLATLGALGVGSFIAILAFPLARFSRF